MNLILGGVLTIVGIFAVGWILFFTLFVRVHGLYPWQAVQAATLLIGVAAAAAIAAVLVTLLVVWTVSVVTS